MQAEAPTLDGRRVPHPEGIDEILVYCKYCDKDHVHGARGRDFGDGDGHRVAHCGGQTPYKSTGYVIREVR